MKRVFGLLAVLAFPAQASAFECYHYLFCGCVTLAGSSATYHIVSTDFSEAEQVAIQGAASTWAASSTGINRGASWSFTAGSDVTSWALNNGTFEIAREPDSWWDGQGYDDATRGVTPYSHSGCTKNATDIIMRSSNNSGAISWSTLPPSSTTSGASLSFAVAHEFGHMVGLQHVEGYPSIMNPSTDSENDVATDFLPLYLPEEDDLVGLREVEPSSSTGNNVALARYYWWDVTGDEDHAQESWEDNPVTEPTSHWHACQGTCLTTYYPKSILAVNLGTSTVNGVDVRWAFSNDRTCGDADDVTFDTTSYNLTPNTPYAIGPDWCLPGGLSVGNYYVCATIDPNDEVSETSALDNKVISEKTFEVESCP